MSQKKLSMTLRKRLLICLYLVWRGVSVRTSPPMVGRNAINKCINKVVLKCKAMSVFLASWKIFRPTWTSMSIVTCSVKVIIKIRLEHEENAEIKEQKQITKMLLNSLKKKKTLDFQNIFK